jgi:predicted ABC-type ATPase
MRNPVITIIAGHNGAGKSTFAREYSREHEEPYLNPDEFDKTKGLQNMNIDRIHAGRTFLKNFDKLLNLNHSFSIETTLSGRYLLNKLKDIRTKYFIKVIYIFLDSPEMAINRIKIRVLNGGHHIPDDDVLRRYGRSKSNFWNIYKNLADQWEIYYNGNEEFIQVAIGSKDKYQIIDEELFAVFKGNII